MIHQQIVVHLIDIPINVTQFKRWNQKISRCHVHFKNQPTFCTTNFFVNNFFHHLLVFTKLQIAVPRDELSLTSLQTRRNATRNYTISIDKSNSYSRFLHTAIVYLIPITITCQRLKVTGTRFQSYWDNKCWGECLLDPLSPVEGSLIIIIGREESSDLPRALWLQSISSESRSLAHTEPIRVLCAST